MKKNLLSWWPFGVVAFGLVGTWWADNTPKGWVLAIGAMVGGFLLGRVSR